MKALLINGSPRDDKSIGYKINKELFNLLKTKYEISQVEELNIYDTDLADYSKEYMAEFYNKEKVLSFKDKYQQDIRQVLLDQFIHADIVIMSMPRYNFSYPTTVKAYIDMLYVPGVTYDTSRQHGDKGLLAPKKELIVITTSEDDDEHKETGLDLSIKEAFEYLGLHSTLTVIPVYSVHKVPPAQITKLLEAHLDK